MKSICIVTSHDFVVRAFLLGHIEQLARYYRVTLVTRLRPGTTLSELPPAVALVEMPIARYIAPLADLSCLLRLYRLLRAGRFDLVHSITPKAGMLAMIAGWAAGVPRRVHTCQGEPWATRSGMTRLTLKSVDRLVAKLATHVTVVGQAERRFLVAENVVPEDKARVLAQGSIAGVDTQRFAPDESQRAAVRARLGIPRDALVALFLGRLRREKGVVDLARAFGLCAAGNPQLWLLVVGPDEDGLAAEIRAACGPCSTRLVMAGETDRPQHFMVAADIVCLPSYREGFPVTVLEAAAAGVPVLASRIYGNDEAVVEDETGLLHPPGDVAAIAGALERLAGDEPLRRRLGEAGRLRAVRYFDRRIVERALLDFYAGLLAS